MTKFIALDLSLTRTGYAIAGTSGVLVPPKGHDSGMPRLLWIRQQIDRLITGTGTDWAVIEGYSFGQVRGSSHSHALGELGGVVRLSLFTNLIQIVDVPPATLKKYATGKGNAGKDEVLAAAIRRLDYDGHDNNVADALWLYAMAMDQLGAPIVEMPKANRESLTKVKWPEIRKERVA